VALALMGVLARIHRHLGAQHARRQRHPILRYGVTWHEARPRQGELQVRQPGLERLGSLLCLALRSKIRGAASQIGGLGECAPGARRPVKLLVTLAEIEKRADTRVELLAGLEPDASRSVITAAHQRASFTERGFRGCHVLG
jgi:hypothetical protein